jgi:hypothetical protein
MITNQLLYQLSYTGKKLWQFGETNRKRKYYKIEEVCASGRERILVVNFVK